MPISRRRILNMVGKPLKTYDKRDQYEIVRLLTHISFSDQALITAKREWGQLVVDINAYTCSCPDFIKWRSEFKVGDPGRLCKHLRKAVTYALNGRFPHMDAIREDSHLHQREAIAELRIGGTLFCYVGLPVEETFYIGIYARRRIKGDTSPPGTGEYDTYALVKDENDWYYQSAPYGAAIIKKALEHLGIWPRPLALCHYILD